MNRLDGIFLRYVGRLFAIRFIGLLLFFVIVLQMLDLLNRSSDILAPTGAGAESLLRYIALRAPQIVSQFTPFAALLAIVVTLSTLNLTSEIVIMRAAGMSVHRVLFPIGLVCLIIATSHFAFHEAVVVRNADRLAYWEANDYALDLPEDSGARADLRILLPGEIVSAQSAARLTEGVLMRGVRILLIDDRGLASGVIEADRALWRDGGWRLFNVRAADHGAGAARRSPVESWTTSLVPDMLFEATRDPERATIGALVREIAASRREGREAEAATTTLLSRLSKPMGALVMPLLGAIAGFGVTRQGNQLARASLGALLGFGYFVSENLMLALGKLGVVPPMIGAFFPFSMAMIIGFSILLAMEN